MNVSLTPELEKWVQSKVESGFYTSASEVIHEALRLLKEQELVREIRLDELRKEIQKGLEQLERGEGTPLDMEEIIALAKQHHEQQQ